MEQVYNNSLESNYINDDEDRCSIILGTRGSGKSTFLINLLKYYYTNETFDAFHLILPSYKLARSDGHGQYEDISKMKNTFIYSGYSPSILKKLVKKKPNERILFACDDATSQGHDITKDPAFLKFFFESRHYRISTILVVHSARKILEKSIRSNCDYLFLARCSNRALRHDLWEEFFSTDISKFDEFEYKYINEVIKSEGYNIWCIDACRGNVDYDVQNWEIQHMDIEIKGKPKAKQPGDKKDDKQEDVKKEVGKKTSLLGMLKGSKKEKTEEKRKDFSSLFFRK